MAPSSSAAMRSIRRELQRRRPKPLVPARPPAAKKPSAPPSEGSARDAGHPRPRRPNEDHPSSTPVSSRSGGYARAPPRPASPRSSSAAASPSTLPPSRPRTKSVGSECLAALGAATLLRPGTEVLVRSRTATLPTGQVLVLWLRRAVVVSVTEGGYEIVYEGEWPPGNPFATVQVARDHVKLPKPSPTTPPPLSRPPSIAAASSCASAATAASAGPKKEMEPTPRPTTGGSPSASSATSSQRCSMASTSVVHES